MKVKQGCLLALLTGICSGISPFSLAQTNLPEYTPLAIGVATSGQFNYTTINSGAHIAAGLSFKPLLVSAFSVYIQRGYTPRQSLLTGISYDSWGLNFGGMGYRYYKMITLPITGRYYFQDTFHRRRWFVEAGPVARFALLGSNTNATDSFSRGYGGSNPTYWTVSAKTQLQKRTFPTLGAIAKLGVEQHISRQWKIGLSAFYHYGFQNIVENTFEAQVSEEVPDPDDFFIDPSSFKVAQQGSLSIRGTSWGLALHVLVYPFPTRKERTD